MSGAIKWVVSERLGTVMVRRRNSPNREKGEEKRNGGEGSSTDISFRCSVGYPTLRPMLYLNLNFASAKPMLPY